MVWPPTLEHNGLVEFYELTPDTFVHPVRIKRSLRNATTALVNATRLLGSRRLAVHFPLVSYGERSGSHGTLQGTLSPTVEDRLLRLLKFYKAYDALLCDSAFDVHALLYGARHGVCTLPRRSPENGWGRDATP